MAKRKQIFKLQRVSYFVPIKGIMVLRHHSDYMPVIVADAKRIMPVNKITNSKNRMPRKLLKVRSVEHEHQYK